MPKQAMHSSELWAQILAAPRERDLQDHFVQALAREGDERAEIFRLAGELEFFTPSYVQHDPLKRRYEASLEVWRRVFEPDTRKWGGQIHFVRGWPSEMTIGAREFARHAAEIVSLVPLQHLNLQAVSDAPEVFAVAGLGQVTTLDASHQPWSHEAILALTNSPHLSSLYWLDLSHARLRDAHVEALAAAPGLRHLAHIDLRGNPCRDPVDAAAGMGVDGVSGQIVPESIWLPPFGRELEARYGRIEWLHALGDRLLYYPGRLEL